MQKSRDHPHPRRDSCSRLDVAQPAQSGEATHLSDISMDPLAAAREQVAQLSAGGGAAPPRSDTDCHFFLLGSCRNVRTPPPRLSTDSLPDQLLATVNPLCLPPE